MLRRAVLVVTGLAAAVGVAVPGAPPAAAAERYIDRVFDEVIVSEDVVYGAAPDEHGERQELRLDVYTPAGDTETRRPAIILAHGGGFVAGRKEDLAALATAYAKRGFVAASITYRMEESAGEIYFPPSPHDLERMFDAREDMQAAVRWARLRSVTWRIDPGRIAVGGSSAGAVTALLTATMPDVPGASGSPGLSSAVCTAVSLAGTGDPALVDAADAGAIFFHGDKDMRVPYGQAVATEAAMAAAGLDSEMVTFPGVAHALGNGALIEQRSSEWLVDVMVEHATSCAGPVDPTNTAFVRAAFSDFVDRAPADEELQQQVDLLDSGLTPGILLRELTTSEEWVTGIVRDLYLDTLGREPDIEGAVYWIDGIREGRRTVAQAAAAFYASPEWFALSGEDVGDWVNDLYGVILGRVPTLDEVAYWEGQVAARGRTWVAVQVHGSIESRRDRVTALYRHLLGRAPDAAGLAYWAGRIATEGDLVLARNLAGSREYRARAVTRFP